jgi:hypothetical protein
VVTPTTISIDVYTPPAVGVSIVFAKAVVPTVAPSLPFFNCFFPDIYILPWNWNSAFTGPGFTTVVTPVVPSGGFQAVFQAGGILGSQIVLSTPATVDL